MIWRRRKTEPEPDPHLEEAKRRLEAAEEDLRKAQADDNPVADVARRMQEMRKANHFAALMKRALRG